MTRELVIAPEKEGQKGRAFSALYMASVQADSLWSGGQATTDNLRPVWLLVATTDDQVRPFMANLRLGRKAAFVSDRSAMIKRDVGRVELLKSARYRVETQRTPHGTAALAFLPELFALDPGMVDPEGLSFCMLLAQKDVDEQVKGWDVDGAMAHLGRIKFHRLASQREQIARLLPLAPSFAAYVDRRTRCPLIKDTRFYAQLMVRCLDLGFASLSAHIAPSYGYGTETWGVNKRMSFQTEDVEKLGYAPGMAFNASHEAFEGMLADCASEFFAKKNN